MRFGASHADFVAGLSLLCSHAHYLGLQATRIAAENRYELRPTLLNLLKTAVVSLVV